MPPCNNDNYVGLFGRRVIRPDEDPDINGDDGTTESSALSFAENPIPLIGVTVNAQVVDFIAEVKLSQSYKNNLTVPIEAVYHFPIDQAASVCDFKAEYEDGTIVNGIIQEKSEARNSYSKAKRHGKQANLLEATKGDILNLQVGNLSPGGFVKITITYVTCLKAQGDAMAFVLPTYVAPRYTPISDKSSSGCEKGSIDGDLTASEISQIAMNPPTSSVKLFGLNFHIDFACHSDIKSITCPAHPDVVYKHRIQGKSGTIDFDDIAMDRDLVLHIVEEFPHQPRASIEVDESGSMAGFVTLFPQIEFKDMKREIIFLVDRSGSMGFGGRSKSQIKQAGDALLLFLRALPPSCSFNIVGFGSRYVPLFGSSKAYNDESLLEASEYASSMAADFGGTEINAPLNYVLSETLEPDTERQIFVLTDGQVSNPKQVFNTIRQHRSHRQGKCRIFTLGVGSGVSRHLVEGMVRAGSGTARFVEGGDPDALRSTVLGQLKQALQPALEEVSIHWNYSAAKSDKAISAQPKEVKTLLGYRSPDASDNIVPGFGLADRMYPSTPPPVFNKQRFLSFTLFDTKDAIPESVTVKCNSPDGPLDLTIGLSMENDLFHGSIAHKLAARTAITEFEDHNLDRQRYGPRFLDKEVVSKTEALKLALVYNLVSEQTSFVAVREDPIARPGSAAAKVFVPQYQPSQRRPMQDSGLNMALPCCDSDSDSDPDSGFSGSDSDSDSDDYGELNWADFEDSSDDDIDDAMRLVGSRGDDDSEGIQLRPVRDDESGSVDSTHDGVDCTDIPDNRKQRCREDFNDGAIFGLLDCEDMDGFGKGGVKVHQGNGQIDAPSTPSTSDQLLKLCLLQSANGSFKYGEAIADGVGLTSDEMKHIADGHPVYLQNPNAFATLLAVAAMRTKFASRRDVWELLADKALNFLSSCQISNIECYISDFGDLLNKGP